MSACDRDPCDEEAVVRIDYLERGEGFSEDVCRTHAQEIEDDPGLEVERVEPMNGGE